VTAAAICVVCILLGCIGIARVDEIERRNHE
jgi:outer membrane murein-binding lipoprotein Lpp